MDTDDGRAARAGLATVATVVVLGLAAWAAFDGRSLVVVDPPKAPSLTPMSPLAGTPTGTPTSSSAPPAAPVPSLLETTWLGPLLVVALGLAALAVYLGRRLLRAWRPLPRPEEADPPALDVLVDARGEDLAAALRTGSPRNGIVECWRRLELLVAAAGHSRRTDETSSELVVRVLDGHAVPEDPLLRLAALYREARFSRHELGEADRTAAAEALDAVRRALAAPAEVAR